MIRALSLLFAISAFGCITDTRPARERGSGNLYDQVKTIEAPAIDRCETTTTAGCPSAKYLAQTYVRRLSVNDEVCLEGGFGEENPNGCKARAAVADSDVNRVLVEIREAQPGSRWFDHVQHQLWFTEGALVDLYLVEHGY